MRLLGLFSLMMAIAWKADTSTLHARQSDLSNRSKEVSSTKETKVLSEDQMKLKRLDEQIKLKEAEYYKVIEDIDSKKMKFDEYSKRLRSQMLNSIGDFSDGEADDDDGDDAMSDNVSDDDSDEEAMTA